jgi:hypothetical protein
MLLTRNPPAIATMAQRIELPLRAVYLRHPYAVQEECNETCTVDECGQKHYAKGFLLPHYKKTGRKSADKARLEAIKASAGRIQEEIGTIQSFRGIMSAPWPLILGLVLTIVWLIVACWSPTEERNYDHRT